MPDFLHLFFLIMGTLGYFSLVFLGPMATRAAEHGEHLLPLFFRVIAILVIVSLFKALYFNHFGLSREYQNHCPSESSVSHCALGEVSGDFFHPETGLRSVVIRFRTHKGDAVQFVSWQTDTNHMLPRIGEDVLVSYCDSYELTTQPGSAEFDPELKKYEYGPLEVQASSKFQSKPEIGDWVLWFVSGLMIVFCVWIEATIRKRQCEFFARPCEPSENCAMVSTT
jgi:hypothetical protein